MPAPPSDNHPARLPSGRATLPPMMRRALVVLVALLALFASGCFSEPSMKLYGARISGATPYGVNLTMTMSVTNDNSFDVMVRDVRADVMLAKRYRLPTVVVSPNIWLPANRTTSLQVPVNIPWSMIGPLVGAGIGSPTIEYRVWGSANVTATRSLEIDWDDYKLDKEGRFYRQELISAAGRGFLGGGGY
jgi:LEA14-like dessication related protein